MALNTTFSKSLFMIAEARCICRSISTQRASLKATPFPTNRYNQPAALLRGLEEPEMQSTPPPATEPRSKNEFAAKLYDGLSRESVKRFGNNKNRTEMLSKLEKERRAKDLEKMQTRRWSGGDVYAPHDLSPAEMMKWRQRSKPSTDVFDILAINPLDEYRNYAMMSEYMTSMGRIKHPRDTGLRRVNQRRIAKAIRRAIGMGWMPSVHQHPEMLRRHNRNA